MIVTAPTEAAAKAVAAPEAAETTQEALAPTLAEKKSKEKGPGTSEAMATNVTPTTKTTAANATAAADAVAEDAQASTAVRQQGSIADID